MHVGFLVVVVSILAEQGRQDPGLTAFPARENPVGNISPARPLLNSYAEVRNQAYTFTAVHARQPRTPRSRQEGAPRAREGARVIRIIMRHSSACPPSSPVRTLLVHPRLDVGGCAKGSRPAGFGPRLALRGRAARPWARSDRTIAQFACVCIGSTRAESR